MTCREGEKEETKKRKIKKKDALSLSLGATIKKNQNSRNLAPITGTGHQRRAG
jgi:hypothetical protein